MTPVITTPFATFKPTEEKRIPIINGTINLCVDVACPLWIEPHESAHEIVVQVQSDGRSPFKVKTQGAIHNLSQTADKPVTALRVPLTACEWKKAGGNLTLHNGRWTKNDEMWMPTFSEEDVRMVPHLKIRVPKGSNIAIIMNGSRAYRLQPVGRLILRSGAMFDGVGRDLTLHAKGGASAHIHKVDGDFDATLEEASRVIAEGTFGHIKAELLYGCALTTRGQAEHLTADLVGRGTLMHKGIIKNPPTITPRGQGNVIELSPR